MNPLFETEMGGSRGDFESTDWTELFGSDSKDTDAHRDSAEKVLARYWKPVYLYLRRKGYDNETGKDMTQGFFHEIVIGRDLVGKADRLKGKFRTYLLTALDRYIVSVYRARSAGKRKPAGVVIRWHELEESGGQVPAIGSSPADSFHYAWATTLLDESLNDVRSDCEVSDKNLHWKLFKSRVVDPILSGAKPLSLRALCDRFGIKDEARASNMITTVKRKFKKTIRAHVRLFVDSNEEVEGEIAELMKILSERRA